MPTLGLDLGDHRHHAHTDGAEGMAAKGKGDVNICGAVEGDPEAQH